MIQEVNYETRIRAMLINCLSYHFVARFLLDKLIREENGYLVSPYITNSVIALEIALKAIYEVETKRKAPRTHDLEQIFNAIPKDSRHRILKLYVEVSGNLKEAFIDTLVRNKNSLQASRYMYEDVPRTEKFRTMERAISASLNYLYEIAPDLYELAEKDEINVRFPLS